MDATLIFSDKELVKKMKDYILEGIDEKPVDAKPDPFWSKLRDLGTELWLDTGNIEEAREVWTKEMTALTTNNTLLNKEIQKGIYDSYIKKAKEIVGKLPLQEQVVAIAFILNARHGLRLTKIFGGFVSVELHTDISYDYNAIVEFGKHYFDINPQQFLVKVPYTAVGLLGARKLRELGVKINLTLEFSARQNAMVVAIARPNYCNVFLGRLGSYLKENNLGDGSGAGEKAVLSSQKVVNEISRGNDGPTKLIAASLREGSQLESLAGVNVFTMPVKVAKEGKEKLKGEFKSLLTKDFQVQLNQSAEGMFVDKLWNVTQGELSLARDLGANPPKDGKELIQRANDAGFRDLFPEISEQDYQTIKQDGKIPKHQKWAERIKKEELAIDTLLNLGGLASFANDQAELDERIKQIIKS